MNELNKKSLSEQDICTKFITPAIKDAGWDIKLQMRQEVYFTDGRINVRGSEIKRGKRKFADYILYWKPHIPIAVVEAKDNNHTVGHGMQQALDYAEILQIPFAFSSNGDGFVMHDLTDASDVVETDLDLSEFPSPGDLWRRYCKANGLNDWKADLVAQDYYDDGSGRQPRYYQVNAVNRTVEAIAQGQDRVLLVMATGTGKTYTAFQIIWRLWKADHKKRILFLADRNILVDQTFTGDFKPFKTAMAKLSPKSKTIEQTRLPHIPLAQGCRSQSSDFGLGFAIQRETGTPRPGSPGALRWGGICNTTFFIDPKEQLIGISMAHLYPGESEGQRNIRSLSTPLSMMSVPRSEVLGRIAMKNKLAISITTDSDRQR